MTLLLAIRVYLTSVPAALQPFTVVLTHQHSDCNRMLALRRPVCPPACPTALHSCPWLPLPALFPRARPLGRWRVRCRGGWRWILDLAEACKGLRTGVWVGGKSVFRADGPYASQSLSLVCAQTLFPVLSFPLALLLPCILSAPLLAPDGVVGSGEKDPGLKVGVRALLPAGPVTIC